MKKDKTILLVGLGAIGSVIYRRLVLHDYKVVCLTNVKSSKFIRRKGLRVKLSTDESLKLHNCEVYGELPEKHIFDRCIISTKSWVNEFLVEDLMKHLRTSASIMLLQNGLNIEDPFLNANNNWKIYRGLTSLAAYRNQVNEAYEASIGTTKIGPINNDETDLLDEWKDLLTEIGLSVIISENIQKDIWLKATVNCTIGPLAAITELKNGDILSDIFLNRIVNYVLHEIISVAPENSSISFEDAMKLLEEITTETSKHKASMLQDIQAERRTEIDVLNGQIIKLAESKGIEVPTNKKLVELVKKVSDKSVPKEQIILELRSL
ncbi:MAG: 2-dehydropantoate 2-reductase [Candidatus Heimdallarchaeota archaeon]|nr:2-dehydropantoate 2-reductase [Candidatus Heimdallarchaeota archaeon]